MKKLRREKKKQKVKKSKAKRIFIYLSLLLLAFILVIGIYIVKQTYEAVDNSYDELDRPSNKSPLREQSVQIGDDPLSILLIGVEDYSTGGENGRADTLIVLTLNPGTEQVTMTSIPRDTRVEFSNSEANIYAGSHKINASYTYGSMFNYGANELTVKKVEELLEIPIDEYVTVGFEGFRDIVNVLGGVTIDIKEPFWEENIYAGGERIYFESGRTKLDGEEALAFVRMRKRDVNAIYPRDERQRQFIQSAVNQVISTKTIFKMGEISDVIGENLRTSLKVSEIYALQKLYASLDSSEIKTSEIEGSNQRINGTYYFIPEEQSLNEIILMLKENLKINSVE
ncbi:Putative transcriptional regulator YvhJ [Paraliobacillus sp. PM-2]|uniref:LCP family protein n=1 Tax=Paraliobacillus sp. PM-2 TaxID=1462524 RepID=UPI00061C46F1|nr:LCP family protein [Paraliobacillus sp. PM-2]CQR47543.1 Putative transcriptional regulator YvhJ [Paraliobacillus sp. PM-2]